MPVQLLFVVETNNKCKSDSNYINAYIRTFFDTTIDHYQFIYMDSKTKYDKSNIEGKIAKATKSYQKTGKTHVIFCMDTDDFAKSREADELNKKIESYMQSKHYDLVWFNQDIEECFINKHANPKEKKALSIQFLQNSSESKMEVSIFKSEDVFSGKRKSNLHRIVSKYLKEKKN